MNHTRLVQLSLLAIALLLSGCRKSADQPAAKTAPSQPAASASVEQSSAPVSPRIVSLSPETVTVRQGQASHEKYSLVYEINGSEKVERAEISVQVPGIGEVQRFDVPVQPRGEVAFFLDVPKDLGPTLRVRARCPEFTTDWYTFGVREARYGLRISERYLGRVDPPYIEASSASTPVPISLWSIHLTEDCKPEAEVDNITAEITSAGLRENTMQAMLSRKELNGRPLVGRYLEMQLIIRGEFGSITAAWILDFVE